MSYSKNITRLHRIYEGDNSLCLLMDYYYLGNLQEVLNLQPVITEKTISFLTAQLLLGAHMLSINNIVHRDLKPENILIHKDIQGDYGLVISDFGLSSSLDNVKKYRLQCGTPGYVAPEILKGDCYDAKADVFSIGCVVFNMLSRNDVFTK
jgi:serine/threonine protein kinase